jgi:hypothetical protein
VLFIAVPLQFLLREKGLLPGVEEEGGEREREIIQSVYKVWGPLYFFERLKMRG